MFEMPQFNFDLGQRSIPRLDALSAR